jgi:glycosyltransferase involved in cell wall biosynthesis
MKKIRVLQLITGLPIGGAEKVLLDLCTHLDSTKIDIFVLGLNDEDHLKDDFETKGIFTKILYMQRTLKSFMATYHTLGQFIQEHNINIIHAHMFHPLVFAYLLKIKKHDLKIVFTSHSENIGGKLRELFTYLFKNFRDTDIVFSKEMIDKVYYKKNTVVIPNGIDTSFFKTVPERKPLFTFLSIGILRPGKNHAFLAKCAKYLKDKGYSFQIEIVGAGDKSGDTSSEIREKITKYHVEDRVKMLGRRRDIPQLLQTAHCFVLPSNFEGLPIALLEAGAAGLPILSTPVGAIPGILTEDMGYLAEHDHFAEKMEYILTHYEEAQSKAKCFYKKIHHEFSIQNMAKAHEKIYQMLI